MVEKEELKKIAKNAINEILEAYRNKKLVDLVNNAIDIRICESFVRYVDGDTVKRVWAIDEIVLKRSYGGPDTEIIVTSDKISAKVCWGSKCIEDVYKGDEVLDIYDILVDIIVHL